MSNRFSFKVETTEKILALPTIDLPDEQMEVVSEMNKFENTIADLPEYVLLHLTNHAILSLVKQQNLHVSQFINPMPQESFIFAQNILQMIYKILIPFLSNDIDREDFTSTMDDPLKYYSKKFATR